VLGVYGAERAKTAGHRILLIDDVVTTGATLAECARTLREAGAAEVVCLALARTRERQPQPGRLGTANVNTGKN
jgi:competence protein ComFC